MCVNEFAVPLRVWLQGEAVVLLAKVALRISGAYCVVLRL